MDATKKGGIMRMPRIGIGSRIGAAAAAVALVGGTALATASPALADPVNAPSYTLDCGGTIYHVVSPGHSVTGSDLNSTSQLNLVVGKGVPQRLQTFCTATEDATGQTFSAYFLITPAG